MAHYIQTNSAGYVTGIISEPSLAMLLGGGVKPKSIPDDQVESARKLLDYYRSCGQGLHINDLNKPNGCCRK